MIERQFIKEKIKEYQIHQYISSQVVGAGHSKTIIKKTPMGDKVMIYAAKPGLVVGRKGENIRTMTNTLKKKFGLENPQLEIEEIANSNLDATVVAERIVKNLERFGTQRFKKIGHQSLENTMRAGALGIEILVTGKIPGARAKRWRFWQGYMKKSGSVSQRDVDECKTFANLKAGTIGVIVRILRPDTLLPDDVSFIEEGTSLKVKHLEEIKNIGGGRDVDETAEDETESSEVVLEELPEEKEVSESSEEEKEPKTEVETEEDEE